MTTNEDHPLPAKWTLWEHRAKSPEDKRWMDQFYQVATVDTVEKFWTLWGHYPKPSTLFGGDGPGDPPPLIARGDRTSRVLGLVYLKDPIPPETRATRDDGAPWTGLRSILDVETSFDALVSWDGIWETLVLTSLAKESDALNGVWFANRTRKSFLPGTIKLRMELWWSSDLDREAIGVEMESLTTSLIQDAFKLSDWYIK